MLVTTDKLAAEPGYHNHSSLVWLYCHSNEATVVVERVKMMMLVDTGSQVTTLIEGFSLEFGLKILPLGGLLHLKGTGVFQSHTRDILSLTLLYQVYPGIMRTCYSW